MADNEKKLGGLLHRSASKYVVTGVLAWVIDNGLFSLLKLVFGNVILLSFGVFNKTLSVTSLMVFTGIGMLAGFVFSFLLNRKWTFRSDGVIGIQLVKCVLLLIFNTIVAAFIVHLSSLSSIGFLPDLVKYGMSLLIGIWNYFAYKYWVYR